MIDEIAQLKAELTDLNMKCQLARDNEVRFALQRGRLEAERTNLLVKMIEALAPSVATPSAVMPTSAYNVTMSPGLTCPKGREVPAAIPVTLRTPAPSRAAGKRKHNRKPENLPATEELIFSVLQGAGWQRPSQITRAIKDRYWPDVTSRSVSPLVWRLGRDQRLEKGELGYRLPVPAAGSPAWTKSNGQVAQ